MTDPLTLLSVVDHEIVSAVEVVTRHCRQCERKGVKACSACVLHAIKKGRKGEHKS